MTSLEFTDDFQSPLFRALQDCKFDDPSMVKIIDLYKRCRQMLFESCVTEHLRLSREEVLCTGSDLLLEIFDECKITPNPSKKTLWKIHLKFLDKNETEIKPYLLPFFDTYLPFYSYEFLPTVYYPYVKIVKKFEEKYRVLFPNMTYTRVLKRSQIPHLPPSIRHLFYWHGSNTFDFGSLSHLPNLQGLKITTCENYIGQVPESIRTLYIVNLSKTLNFDCKLPEKMESLKINSILRTFNLTSLLPNLRSLYLSGVNEISSIPTSVQTLVIRNSETVQVITAVREFLQSVDRYVTIDLRENNFPDREIKKLIKLKKNVNLLVERSCYMMTYGNECRIS